MIKCTICGEYYSQEMNHCPICIATANKKRGDEVIDDLFNSQNNKEDPNGN